MDNTKDRVQMNVAEWRFGQQIGELVVNIHSEEKCAGSFCTIHNPSDHPLKDAPMNLRMDRGMLIERLCEHGVGHPDPDSAAWYLREYGESASVHGCDGCCRTEIDHDQEWHLDAEFDGLFEHDSDWHEIGGEGG